MPSTIFPKFRWRHRASVRVSQDGQPAIQESPAGSRSLTPSAGLATQGKGESNLTSKPPLALNSKPRLAIERINELESASQRNETKLEHINQYQNLHEALKYKDAAKARLLLDSCPDPDYNLQGQRAIHLAVFSPELIQLLLARGANVNAQDSNGRLPLHHAAQLSTSESTQSAELLIKAESHLEQKNNQNWTPLMEASSAHNVGIMRALILAGADARATDDHGLAPLHLCCQSRANKRAQHEAVRLLVSLPWVDVDDVDERDRSPLFLAAVHFRSSLVRTLLDVGADAKRVDLKRLRYGHLVGIRYRHCLYECEAVWQIRKAVGHTASIYGGDGLPEGYEHLIRLDDTDNGSSMNQILPNGNVASFVFSDVSLINILVEYKEL